MKTRRKQQGGHHLYKRLGVSKYASQKLIRKAFKTLKKKRKANKKVKEAYKILSNKKTRKQYNDRYRKRSRKGGVKTIKLPPRKKHRDVVNLRKKNFWELSKDPKKNTEWYLTKKPDKKKYGPKFLHNKFIPKYRPDITPKGKEEFSKKWNKFIKTVPDKNKHLVYRVISRSGKYPYALEDHMKYITYTKYATEQDKKSIFEVKKKEKSIWDLSSSEEEQNNNEEEQNNNEEDEKGILDYSSSSSDEDEMDDEIFDMIRNDFKQGGRRRKRKTSKRTGRSKRKTRKRRGGNENCYGFRNLEDSKLCKQIHQAAQYYNTNHPEKLSTGQKIARKIKNRTTRRNRPKPETPRQVAQQKQATFLEFKNKLQPVLAKLKENEDNIRADLIETIEGPDDPTGEKQRVLEAEYDEAFSKTNEKLMLMKEINANLSSDKSPLPAQIEKARNDYSNRGRVPLAPATNFSNFNVAY